MSAWQPKWTKPSQTNEEIMKRTVTTWVMMFIVSLALNAQTMEEQIINKVKQVL